MSSVVYPLTALILLLMFLYVERDVRALRAEMKSHRGGPVDAALPSEAIEEAVAVVPALWRFVFYNHTTDLAVIKAIPQIAEALTQQINNEVRVAYGDTASFRVGVSPSDRKLGEVAIHIRPSLPEAPGALAYHQTTNGCPDIEIGMDGITSLLQGSDSLACGISHEVNESLGDPGANQWADLQDGTGKMRPVERCDRVQNIVYDKTVSGGVKVSVSNWLLRSAFIPGAPAPWDYVSQVTGKKSMSNQLDYSSGYDMEATSPTDVHQCPETSTKVTAMVGSLVTLSRKRKASVWSRAYRRGARIAKT